MTTGPNATPRAGASPTAPATPVAPAPPPIAAAPAPAPATARPAADSAALLALYPALAELPAPLLADVLAHHAHHLVAPAGQRLFDAGRPCPGFPLVLRGAVRVARQGAGGRTLELYRVTPGELCVVSTSCLFSGTPLSAQGHAVAETELLLLSPAGLDLCCAHPGFRRHVFGVFAERMADLIELAEAVAFQRLDQRLSQALLGHGAGLHTTHQALADSLGTVREIVSRLLARFERQGYVRLGREHIEVLDSAALRAIAAGQEPPAGA